MEVSNATMPDEEQMAGFMELDDGTTIYMVNLLKYKEKAEYADGRNTELSGREAYALYAAGVESCLAKVGGGLDFKGDVRRLTLGSVEELWDEVLQMMQLPEMKEFGQHRSAGLAGQLNIETGNG
jgi:hypothetical protein